MVGRPGITKEGLKRWIKQTIGNNICAMALLHEGGDYDDVEAMDSA
jgi:hypothetical protein